MFLSFIPFYLQLVLFCVFPQKGFNQIWKITKRVILSTHVHTRVCTYLSVQYSIPAVINTQPLHYVYYNIHLHIFLSIFCIVLLVLGYAASIYLILSYLTTLMALFGVF